MNNNNITQWDTDLDLLTDMVSEVDEVKDDGTMRVTTSFALVAQTVDGIPPKSWRSQDYRTLIIPQKHIIKKINL